MEVLHRQFIRAVVTCFLLAFMADAAFSQEQCNYDPNGVDYNYFIKHTNFSKAEWDNNKKEAKVALENGDEAIVSYSACYELGVTAKYRMKKSAEKLKSAFLVDKILWLGKKILKDKSDYELLINGLKNPQFVDELENIRTKERVFVGIEGSDYQSFLVYVVYDKSDFYVEISWSM